MAIANCLNFLPINCKFESKTLEKDRSIYIFGDLVAIGRDDSETDVMLLALLAPSDKMLSIVISIVYSLFLKSIVTYWKTSILLPIRGMYRAGIL